MDFVIPRGETGGAVPSQLLNAYSTPPQPGTDGAALIFDQNGTTVGNSIAHTAGDSTVTIQDTGYYFVGFHATLSPASGVNFPLSITLNLYQQGADVYKRQYTYMGPLPYKGGSFHGKKVLYL